MKIILLTICTFIFFLTGLAQEKNFIGKVEYVKEERLASGNYEAKNNGITETFFNKNSYGYTVKYKMDFEKLANRAIETNSALLGTDSFEIARQKEKIKTQMQSQFANALTNFNFVDYVTNTVSRPRVQDGLNYCVVDTFRKLNFELKDDTLNIEGIFCQKARVFFANTYFNVWFAPSIPFAAGPMNLYGLPGLIIYAISEDEKIRYRMTSLTYPLQVPQILDVCSGGKTVTMAEYTTMQVKQREAMLERKAKYLNKKDDD